MKVFLSFFFLFILILTLIVVVSLFFYPGGEDHGSPFECGFSSFSSFVSPPFSMPFFVISLMFLLFDVEIILLFFFPYLYSFSYYSSFFLWFMSLVILFSTIYEWFKGLLTWL